MCVYLAVLLVLLRVLPCGAVSRREGRVVHMRYVPAACCLLAGCVVREFDPSVSTGAAYVVHTASTDLPAGACEGSVVCVRCVCGPLCGCAWCLETTKSDRRMYDEKRMNVNEFFYSQENVSSQFHEGRSLRTLMDMLSGADDVVDCKEYTRAQCERRPQAASWCTGSAPATKAAKVENASDEYSLVRS